MMMRSKIFTGMLVMALTFGMNVSAAELDYGSKAAEQDQTYTVEEMLQYAIEDERMAQAEYTAIIEAFDVTRPFTNILRAEYRHEALILDLYDVYGYEVPTFDGDNYTVVPDTLEEIYSIGVEAEIANIKMYNAFLEEDLDAEIAEVFEVLRDGSLKHLAAFENQNSGRSEGKGRRGRR